MVEQWNELKETIIEMRDNDGMGTQQEVCKFLASLMDVLEKQMQEPKTANRVKNELKRVKNELNQEDCISRQAALEEIIRFSTEEGSSVECSQLYCDVNNMPSVNPAPKMGHWIETYEEIDSKYGRHSYKCSECNKYAHYFIGGSEDWWDVDRPHYCPNCGAKMESEVEE